MRRRMQVLFLAVLFAAGSTAGGGTVVPDSSILPAQLEKSVSSKNAKPGEVITARIMQAVPLLGDAEIPAGSKMIGKVTAVQSASGKDGGSISFRFDTLRLAHENIQITVRLRAIASDAEVRQAQLPRNPDPSIPENAWTTVQIGGDVVYRGGGPVRNRSGVVGKPVLNGVLVRLDSNPGRGCRHDGTGERAQAMWLFSSDACGAYGMPRVTIAPVDPSATAGTAVEITLRAADGNVNLRNGTGLLLRVSAPENAGP